VRVKFPNGPGIILRRESKIFRLVSMPSSEYSRTDEAGEQGELLSADFALRVLIVEELLAV